MSIHWWIPAPMQQKLPRQLSHDENRRSGTVLEPKLTTCITEVTIAVHSVTKSTNRFRFCPIALKSHSHSWPSHTWPSHFCLIRTVVSFALLAFALLTSHWCRSHFCLSHCCRDTGTSRSQTSTFRSSLTFFFWNAYPTRCFTCNYADHFRLIDFSHSWTLAPVGQQVNLSCFTFHFGADRRDSNFTSSSSCVRLPSLYG